MRIQVKKKKNHYRVGTNCNTATFSQNVQVGAYIAIEQMRSLKPTILHVQAVKAEKELDKTVGRYKGYKYASRLAFE